MADEYIRKQDPVDALDRIFDNVPMELTTEILRLRRELRGLHAADVVPVVRCRDCKRWNNGNVIIGCYWDVDGGQPEEMDFCSRGERREE